MAREVAVALAGVGNASSIFVQGLNRCRRAGSAPGLWHERVGGLGLGDVRIAAAFDIDQRKVGRDLSEAIFAHPNVTEHLETVPVLEVTVQPGILADASSEHLDLPVIARTAEIEKVATELRAAGVEVLVNLTSSGLERSAAGYAEAALAAGACFVNATPTSIATSPDWAQRFARAGLVVVGDDLMSQFGGTALHRGLLDLLDRRGIRVGKSYQLDVGGGLETRITIAEKIRAAKRRVKTAAVVREVPYAVETVAGTTDYVDFMQNRRTSYFWVSGAGFLDSPVLIDIYLHTVDGPNAANILLDVVRAVAAARREGQRGAVPEICNYGFKETPRPAKLLDSYELFAARYLTDTGAVAS